MPAAVPNVGATAQEERSWTWLQTVVFLTACYLFSLGTIALRRLYLSPLSDFPGPTLAALSNWYEFYYDVIKGGKFTQHIQELHRKYGTSFRPSVPMRTQTRCRRNIALAHHFHSFPTGPIIRITPAELHIDDPDYFDTLYGRGATPRRDKFTYFSARFGWASDAFSTAPHDLHRSRRQAIAPFFSARSVEAFQPTIRSKVAKLCGKLDAAAGSQDVVRISRAMMALTTDIITEYAFARSYDHLDSPDFEDIMHEALVEVYVTGHFALHFPIVFPILDMLPEDFVRRFNPAILPVLGIRRVSFLRLASSQNSPEMQLTDLPRLALPGQCQTHPRNSRRHQPGPSNGDAPDHIPRAPTQRQTSRRGEDGHAACRRSTARHRRRPHHHVVDPVSGSLPSGKQPADPSKTPQGDQGGGHGCRLARAREASVPPRLHPRVNPAVARHRHAGPEAGARRGRAIQGVDDPQEHARFHDNVRRPDERHPLSRAEEVCPRAVD